MTSRSLLRRSAILSFIAGVTLAVPSAFSQTLTITNGQGQILAPSQPSTQLLQVLLLGSNGQPIVGAPITFTAFSFYGGYVPTNPSNFGTNVYFTDSTGTASVTYVGANLSPTATSVPYDSATVLANYANLVSATFYETTSNVNQQGSPLISVNFTPLIGLTFSGAAGSVSQTPLQLQVTAQTNGGGLTANVPNVALTLVLDPSSTGTISCQEGTFVLTNSAGVATCTPLFGKVGSGSFTVTVGGAFNSNSPIPFQVTVGPPALIQITSGNNQSGTPGQQLPLPIVVAVTDLGGNPTPNIQMNFTSVTPGGATFTGIRNPTDASGKVSANVVLGNVPGNITISVSDTGGLIRNPAIFTETVNLIVTGITISTGNNQSAFINTGFSVPLTVSVATTQGAVSGTPVTFAVGSGSATLSTTNTTTNGQGQASTTVTAGSTVGPVIVTASTGQYSVNFNLNVIPLGPSNLSFTNGASGAVNSLSPGSIVTIYGNGLANNLQGVTTAFDVGPQPLSIGGVSVQFGGQYYAPIFDVGNITGSQFVTIQVPTQLSAGSTSVTIAIAGGGSTTVPVTIGQASPGLFTYTGANNQPLLVAILPDGSVAGPTNPATRGTTVTVYLTGVPLTPGVSTNAFPPPGSAVQPQPLYPITLGVNNQGTAYTSAAYSPDLLGVETLTFTVPTSLGPGAAQISIGVQTPSGAVYSQYATLNVQ
jgi:uncharacterized protein (TIGR03437 family)